MPAHPRTNAYTRLKARAKPRFCYICCGAVPPRYKYCARCNEYLDQGREISAHVLALKAAWDPVAKGFRCYYTNVILEERDLSSPWYITFDHRIPGKKGDLVVCAAWVNSMKNQLSEEEFKAVIIELARCREAGEPFNMAVAKFEYWRGGVSPKPKKLRSLTNPRIPKVGHCFICSATTFPYSLYCPRCRDIILRVNTDMMEHAAAAKSAWDREKKAFICYLTGLALDTSDNKSPLFLTFDHQIPRKPGTMKVAAAFVNVMKNALSEEEFWLVVKELARHFQTGEPFDKDIIKFAYWKGWAPARRRAARARRSRRTAARSRRG